MGTNMNTNANTQTVAFVPISAPVQRCRANVRVCVNDRLGGATLMTAIVPAPPQSVRSQTIPRSGQQHQQQGQGKKSGNINTSGTQNAGNGNGKKPSGGRHPEYYANVGAAIEQLREDYPYMLVREPCLDIFSEHIVLRDRRKYDVHGKELYASFLWTVRMHAKVLFRHAEVSIQSMYHDDREGRVYLRWRVAGIPRFLSWNGSSQPWVYDGISRYSFDSKGFVFEHDLDQSVSTNSGNSIRSVYEQILSLGVIPISQPVPSLCQQHHQVNVDEEAGI
mmetsp:Transcript_20277/g.34980  ORF Transcript_20277/g.34980 Transcript_20277/m.34980 type:complete len:278 (+) Transcript_20277:208-1041(+)